MSEAEASPPFVFVLKGPGASAEFLQHTFRALDHFGILYEEADWNAAGLAARLQALAARGAFVVVFGTGVPYTDEHFACVPDDVPIIKVVNAPPDSGQFLTTTEFVTTAGFGVDGAVNAGLLAARILARGNEQLRTLLNTHPYPPS
jgi:hypothetical protein